MANGDLPGVATDAKSALSDNIQAHIGRATHFADNETRDWSLFVFFRIQSQAEFKVNMQRVAAVLDAKTAAEKAAAEDTLVGAMSHQSCANAGLTQQKLQEDL